MKKARTLPEIRKAFLDLYREAEAELGCNLEVRLWATDRYNDNGNYTYPATVDRIHCCTITTSEEVLV